MNLRAILVACVAALSGCASTGPGGIGGAATGLIGGSGSAKGSAIVDALGGGLVAGIELGSRDRRSALEAEYRALEHTPSGEQVVWRSPDPELYGEVVAAQPYRVGSQDCRQYTHTVYADGQPRAARGTACRNSDGSWTLLI